MDVLEFIRIKICSAEDTVKRMRRKATVWENISAKDITDKELLP